MSNTERIPFDMEAFKAGAVAVDRDGDEVTFKRVDNGSIWVSYTDKHGNQWNCMHSLERIGEHWRMKHPTKYIVYREFDSEEDAINLRSQLNHYGFSGYDEADNEYEDKSKWKIEKR